MIRHIEPFDNKNKPIVDIDNKIVPLVYFNRLFLNSDESSEYSLENHETMIVVVKGRVSIQVDDVKFSEVGKRDSLWTGKPEGVYAGKNSHVKITSISNNEPSTTTDASAPEPKPPETVRTGGFAAS